MDIATAWENLTHAISDVNRPDGEYDLKLRTVRAGVQLLFEFPAEDILERVEGSSLPTRAIVSWLVFEGDRMSEVDTEAVNALRDLYESRCPAGEGIIPPPQPGAARPLC